MQANDPKTAYWSSSPNSYINELADRKSGDEHDWTIWFGQKPFSDFGVEVPRFVSEYGLQAFPEMYTIHSFAAPEDQAFDSQVMNHRQRSRMDFISPGFNGNSMIKWYMEHYYQVPDSFEDFVYVSQLLQAHAYKIAIEAHRRAMSHCMGSLYWQLNDSWPTISWSSVDYYGRWKASHYAVRDANSALLVSPVVEDGLFKVYAVSDRLMPVDGKLTVSLIDFSGSAGYTREVTVEVPANTSTVLFAEAVSAITGEADLAGVVVKVELLEGETPVAQNLFYFKEPKDLNLPLAKVDHQLEKTEKGYQLTLSSNVLVKNLYISTPYGNVFASDGDSILFFDI